jgi:hypothetical protein
VAMSGMMLTVVLGLLGLPDVIGFLDEYIAPHVSLLAGLPQLSLARTGVLVLSSLAVVGLPLLALGYLFWRLRWVTWKSRIERD